MYISLKVSTIFPCLIYFCILFLHVESVSKTKIKVKDYQRVNNTQFTNDRDVANIFNDSLKLLSGKKGVGRRSLSEFFDFIFPWSTKVDVSKNDKLKNQVNESVPLKKQQVKKKLNKKIPKNQVNETNLPKKNDTSNTTSYVPLSPTKQILPYSNRSSLKNTTIGKKTKVITAKTIKSTKSTTTKPIPTTTSTSKDDTKKAILESLKNELENVEVDNKDYSSNAKGKRIVKFGKLNVDGNKFDYESLPNGVWKIKNAKKFSFTCLSGEVPEKYKNYLEIIEVVKKNDMNQWVTIKTIENKDVNKKDLLFQIEIKNDTLKNMDFQFLTFIGDYQCKYYYKKHENSNDEFVGETDLLKIRFDGVTFLIEADIPLKNNVKISCPMLDNVKMYRQSSIYFDENSNNYVNGNLKRDIFTTLPKNSIRVNNGTSILIKNLKDTNFGYYHCVYTDGTPNNTELRIVYKLFSDEYDKLKISGTHLKFIFVYMLLTLIILCIALILQ